MTNPHAPYPPPQPGPQQPHGQGVPPQYAAGGYIPPAPQQTFPTQAITKTRRPFNHSKHIMWTVLTGGMWGFGYLWLWAWNKYGPEKAVSVTQYR